MPTYYYGVDSVQDARQVIPTLERIWGVPPAVYARYIVGGYVTSRAEMDAILAKGIRAVHVCNFGDAGTVGGTADQGAADARTALLAMRATGCPDKHGLLFRDIESAWVPSVGYLTGWSGQLAQAQQPGGFYANAEWATFDTPYAALVGVVARRYRYVWTSEPENVGYVPPPGPAWNPFAPPSDPAACIGWQFVEQPAAIPNIDCNLWTEEAYSLMYGAIVTPPKPVYPYTTNAATRADLKAADPATGKPSHGSPVAIDEHHRPVTVEVGGDLVVTGDVVHTDDVWRPCKLPDPSPVQGWFLDANLKQDS